MALLSKLQKHLDDRLIRSTAVQHGKTLSLRGTFKQRDGSSKRMRVSLDLPAEDDQLIHAESRSSEFWAEYQRLGYLPDPMPWVVKVTPLPFTKTMTVNSAISQLEADFFRGKEPNAVVANRKRHEAANTRLIRCACTLRLPLNTKLWLDHVLERNAHHPQCFCTAFRQNGRLNQDKSTR